MTKTIIFDLGNVIVSFDHQKMYNQVASLCNLPVSIIRNLSLDSGIGMQLETGEISSSMLHAMLCDLSKKNIDYSSLMHAIADIFIPKQDMISLVEELKEKQFRLMLLSNISEAHFTFLKNRLSFFDCFDEIILSYEVKMHKPEKAIFQHALSLANCKPSQCFFIDDMVENVNAAIALGMIGHVFQSHSHLINNFKTQGILS